MSSVSTCTAESRVVVLDIGTSVDVGLKVEAAEVMVDDMDDISSELELDGSDNVGAWVLLCFVDSAVSVGTSSTESMVGSASARGSSSSPAGASAPSGPSKNGVPARISRFT